jgi:hypothetical protein
LHYYRNLRIARLLVWKNMTPQNVSASRATPLRAASVLAWPAWLRVLAVLPAVALLWLAVAWAQVEVAPW